MRAAFHTLGCKVNQYETEAIRERFAAAGFEIVEEDKPADVYVINTCTVTNLADRKSRQYIRRMKKLNPEAVVAVTGCYAQVSPEELAAMPEVDIVAGTGEKGNLLQYVEEFLRAGRAAKQLHIKSRGELCAYQDSGIITSMESRTRAYIKIQEGCDRFCAYCMIPYARGQVRSRSLEEITAEARALVDKGFKELILTGINTALYGTDLAPTQGSTFGTDFAARQAVCNGTEFAARQNCNHGTGFSATQAVCNGTDLAPTLSRPSAPQDLRGVEAVVKAVSELDGDFRIRLSSLEPTVVDAEYALRLTKYPKLCRHFHLSAQSGSDAVLAGMNRRYTAAEYMGIVKALRDFDPLFGISTDIIAGFPGETEKDHADSLRLIEEACFCKTHVFRYSRRKGTAAASMDGQVSAETKNRRGEELIEAGERAAADFLGKAAGSVRTALIEKQEGAFVTGYTDNYVKVYAAGDKDDLNSFVRVKLTEIYKDGMKGEKL